MQEYLIHPIPQLSVEMDESQITYLQNIGQKIEIVTYVWYLEGGSQTIIVDAGASIDRFKYRGQHDIKEIQTIEDGLAKYGIKPDDIDKVIMTHLHHDHIAQASIFKKAEFLVQKAEVEGAAIWNSHPIFEGAFPPELITPLNLHTIEGDVNIADGIDVLLTPGHTAGGQSVAVNTSKGLAIIAGGCSIQANFEPSPEVRNRFSVIAPGLHLSATDGYDSFARIKELADIIIPLHDSRYMAMTSVTE
ncbi:N-acyl homoserine lactonase family protein [Chloroflexota bacterium]